MINQSKHAAISKLTSRTLQRAFSESLLGTHTGFDDEQRYVNGGVWGSEYINLSPDGGIRG